MLFSDFLDTHFAAFYDQKCPFGEIEKTIFQGNE
jgi:hypothetical protein